MFLPKIEKLVIQTASSERSYKKLEMDGDVLVSATVDGINTDYLWRVFKLERRTAVFNDTDNEEKEYSYGISTAFCEGVANSSNNCLYSYFKTKVEFPIGWLCHADFELRSDRNDIIDHSLKKLILQELVLDVNITELARFHNYDASYLSRIRSGQKRPADVQAFIDGISRFIVRRYTWQVDRAVLSKNKAPVIYFVIHHSKMVDARENFIVLVAEQFKHRI